MKYTLITGTAIALIIVVTVILTNSNTQPASDQSGIHWEEKIEIASGDAYQGMWMMNESDFRYVDAPSVDINENSYTGIVWVDQSRKDVLFQLFEPDGEKRLDEPVNVSRSPDIFSWLPRVVISGGSANEIYILWQEIVFSGGSHGGEIFFARSTDGGRSFSDPVNLSDTIAGAAKGRLTARYWDNGSLDIIQHDDGNLYVAWTEYEGKLRFSRSTDRGETFSDPVHVDGDNNLPARGPSLAVNENGKVYIAWTVGEDPEADIRLATSNDGGESFGETQIVFESEGHSDAPKIAFDRDGALHLTYAESPAGLFQRYQIRYSRSFDGGNTFEGSREITSPQRNDFESAHFPSLSVNGRNNVYLVWELFPDRQRRSLGLGFTYSTDAGETFASPSVIPGTDDPGLGMNGSLQGLLMRKLAVNTEGELVVVNNTFRQNRSSHVWLMRGNIEPPR